MDDFQKELETGRSIARQAGEIALRYYRTGIAFEAKSDDSPVTRADRECEQFIARELERAFPDDGLLGEEGAQKPSRSGRRWIIDPIDGTRDFVRGNPVWANLIGLEAGRRGGGRIREHARAGRVVRSLARRRRIRQRRAHACF